MSGGSGRRGSSPTIKKRKRSLSPPPKKNEKSETSRTSKRDKFDSSEKTSSRRSSVTTDYQSSRPRTKQEQRRNTMSLSSRHSPPVRPRPVWPSIGTGEVTGQQHHDAVWGEWNTDKLIKLWDDLADNEPHRGDLIRTVQRQLIRAQLYKMMGGGIPNQTLANIQIDGSRRTTTDPRKAKEYRVADKRRTSGSYREREVWNASLHDTEVDTVRDIEAWADRVSKEKLEESGVVAIDLVGTSGPCEACKERLALMADRILDGWSRKHNLRMDQLPELQLWSYYGNPPDKLYPRGPFDDVRNGWLGDATPGDLTFTNRAHNEQLVREHRVVRLNPRAPVVAQPPVTTTTTQVPEKTDKSEDLSTTDV